MQRFACLPFTLAALIAFTPAVRGETAAAGDPAVRYATSMGSVGFAERISEVMRRQAVADAAGLRSERNAEEKENEHGRPNRQGLPQNPLSSLLPSGPAAPAGAPGATGSTSVLSPQVIGTSFTAATLSGINPTSSFPPDNMGAVGPTQYVAFENGRLVTFDKNTGVADGALNADPDVFFGSVRGSTFTSDPRVRYDRLTGRWFLVIINTSTPNRILFAVSDAASNGIISGSTTFTFFFIPIDTTPPTISNGCLADYPTLGLDANALYVGTNNFCSGATTYAGTDGYVIRKTSIMGAGPLVVTVFRSLSGAAGSGPYTPQGVDNYDPAATEGYFIGVDNAAFGLLQLRRVSNPGGSPTISANIPITVPATAYPVTSNHLGNTGTTNGKLDAIDDRLYAAHIRNGQLWTAHNIAVTNTGVASGAGSRDGSRWYQINVPPVSGTPTLVQSGTVYTASASNTTDQRNYFIPSIMVSGQGHAAMTFTTAGTNERANSATVGRLAGDATGTMQTPVLITNSTTAYNPPGDNGAGNGARRWGDYTYVSLDPLDDMTMWAVSQFCNATNSYGVRVTKLIAPPPATPVALADATAGLPAITLTLTGTSTGGSGFYDPGTDPPGGRPFSHLAASITNGAATGTPPTVVSATYLTPTTVSLVLDASAATPNAGAESYTLNITNPDGQVASAAVVHVVAGGPPAVTIAAGPSANEGNSGTTLFNFTVNVLPAAAVPVTVHYQTSDGSATVADNDYVAVADSITILPGITSGTIHVSVIGDTKYEPGETLDVTLLDASGAPLGATVSATGTVLNDDPVPVVAIVSSAAAAEGNSGATPLSFGVTLSNPSASAVSVPWTTSDNTATTADGDYVTASGTLVISEGAVSGSLSVDVNGDITYENNEGFTVTLSSPSGASLGNAVATGTITNDDTMPSLSIDSVEHLEGDAGTTTYRFTASLSEPSGVLTAVDWATADGSALSASGDYTAANGSLAFPPGTTTQTLDVLVNGDVLPEADETFTVELASPTSATLAAASGTGTITNDDATPLISIAAVTAPEGTGGVTAFRFVVTLSAPSGLLVSAHYETADGSATLAGADYAGASGTVTFAPSAVADTVTVSVLADSCGEATEAFTVGLSSPLNAAILTPLVLGTIENDDDVTPPSVAVVQPNGGEALGVGGVATLQWTATDSAGVAGVDLLLSRDGGVSYPEVIASGIANSGTYFWTVTAPVSTTAMFRVLAHDNACNAAGDASDAAFAIDDHVSDVAAGGPVTAFALGAVQPNPTRGSIRFGYDLPRDSRVRLSVVDVQGREIAVIADGEVAAGRHTAAWSGSTPGGQAARGLYFVRYIAGGRVFSRRFALVR